jgi:hypothetical protein
MRAIFTILFILMVILPTPTLCQDQAPNLPARDSINKELFENSKEKHNNDTVGMRDDSIDADRLHLNWSAFLRHLKSEESDGIIDRVSDNDNSLPWFILLNKPSLLEAPKKDEPVYSDTDDANAGVTAQFDDWTSYQRIEYYVDENTQTIGYSNRNERLISLEVDSNSSEPGGRINNSTFWIIDARKIMDDEPEILYRGRDPVQSPIWNIFLKIKMNFQGP